MKMKINKVLKILLILMIVMAVLFVGYIIWEHNQEYIYKKVEVVDCIATDVCWPFVICSDKEDLDYFFRKCQEEFGLSDDSINELRRKLENKKFTHVIAMEKEIGDGKICIDHWSDIPGQFSFNAEETPGQVYVYITNAYAYTLCYW